MAITPRHALATLALLLAAPACRSANVSLSMDMPDASAGRADTAAADRPTGDSAAPVGPASAVTGKQVGHWLSDQPEFTAPSNFANAKVSAWVERDGGWKFFPGQGTADGKLSVSDVPAGPFLFRLNENYFAASTMRDFDLDFTSLGRRDRPAPRIRPTPLTGSRSPTSNRGRRAIASNTIRRARLRPSGACSGGSPPRRPPAPPA
jgi:hypothetical protein